MENRLKTVLERLRLHGLRVKPKKWRIVTRHISFLEHVVSGFGIMPDPAKIEALNNISSPRNIKDTSKQNKTVSKIPEVLGNNKYSSLEVEQTSEDDEAARHTLIEDDTGDDEDKNPKSKPANGVSKSTIRASKKPEKEIRQQHQQENEKESQRKVEICGDSMTKYIQAHKLGRSTNDRVTSK